MKSISNLLNPYCGGEASPYFLVGNVVIVTYQIWSIYVVYVVLFVVGTSCASILMEFLFCSFKKIKIRNHICFLIENKKYNMSQGK